VLPGFSHVHVLGSGGFADVFLYEQHMPRRQVAVKVMLREVVDEHVRQMFQAEANLMAQLSSHPSILTVYEAGVSSDGRPFLVMELCSAGLSARYRAERLPVPDALRIAVKIGSAIETAHRASVLHRDIKPSNILTTAYGHPVLSDFGIAATLGEAADRESVGLSIPWSAPEVLKDETPGTIASEVWSFGATVYSLLAGRSPFEVPGEPNSSSDLIARINRGKPQPIGRGDVPPSLEGALARSMSRSPAARHGSVLELVHELQAVESELGMPQTPVEVARDDWAQAAAGDLDDRTIVRAAAGTKGSVASRRRKRRNEPESYQPVGTLMRDSDAGPRVTGSDTAAPGRAGHPLAWLAAGATLLAVVLGAIALTVLWRSGSDGIPVVSGITAEVAGDAVEFSWRDPGLLEGDGYQVSTGDGHAPVQQRAPSFTVNGEAGERACITVTVVREGKAGAPSAEKCVDVPL
jgi:tRNA A-37 threonylcarbamoyl transferase component Bud32